MNAMAWPASRLKLRANPTFRPGNQAKLEALLVPRIIAAVARASEAVVTEAKAIVPVDTGELQESIHSETVWAGTKVTGTIQADAPHAAFVEFGTGQRGAASPGAGPYPYSSTWPGMVAQPYMRPALDTAQSAITEAFAAQGLKL
jgi:HK97 gp10 family phage protein